MGLHYWLLNWSVIILPSVEPEQTIHAALGKIFSLGYHMDLHWTLVCLTFFKVTHSLSLMIWTLPARPMITSCTVEVTLLITSFFHCKILLKNFFSNMKPNSVKQPKKRKHWQMPFTFEQKLQNLSRSSFFFHQK